MGTDAPDVVQRGEDVFAIHVATDLRDANGKPQAI
jgi:hypothetical protein